jgi:hypothetical protein
VFRSGTSLSAPRRSRRGRRGACSPAAGRGRAPGAATPRRPRPARPTGTCAGPRPRPSCPRRPGRAVLRAPAAPRARRRSGARPARRSGCRRASMVGWARIHAYVRRRAAGEVEAACGDGRRRPPSPCGACRRSRRARAPASGRLIIAITVRPSVNRGPLGPASLGGGPLLHGPWSGSE